MKKGSGTSVYPGIAIGAAVVFQKKEHVFRDERGNTAAELEKFHRACQDAKEQLAALYEKAVRELGEAQAAIVEVQILMLEDPDFTESVTQEIAGGKAAAMAVTDCGERMAEMFAALNDEYMSARASDIRDVCHRVTNILCGIDTDLHFPEESFILVAKDLAPSETIQLPRERILSIVTQQGSTNSHTAILARALGIPSLIQADIDLKDVTACHTLAVDGDTGEWMIEPDDATQKDLRNRQQECDLAKAALEQYRGKKSLTKSGKQVHLYANIGCLDDAKLAIAGDAEGVGLLRSEFLYIGRNSLPQEEEQYEAYRKVAECMSGRPIIIRTLDIGADKCAEYLNLPKEENPALGLRGLRLCLTRKELFRTQLRAIYRASVQGNISVMFPMVSALWELQQAKQICAEVRQELAQQGHPVKEIPIGVMIETPAAAVLADQFAKEADFLSVGTNDLTQYTLALDRQNPGLHEFFDPYHPALLALLEHIAACANKAGIWAGICGELGADTKMTETFIRMGYRELSMSPGKILEIRKFIWESEA